MYPITYKTSTRTSYVRTHTRTHARTNTRKVYNVYIITISKPVNYFSCSFPCYYLILSVSIRLLSSFAASAECAVAQVQSSNNALNEWIILKSTMGPHIIFTSIN